MISHPDPNTVVTELGDEVVGAIVHAVKVAKEEFNKYRQLHPDWAANAAPRTLASTIHDWMWTDLQRQLEQAPHVHFIDHHPRREIAVQVESPDRLSYLLRIKLHHLDGRTSSYQTQTVMDFELQRPSGTLPGLDRTHLEAGYEWDKDARTMGAPVISLRDGRAAVWVHQLPEQDEEDGGTVVHPTQPQPTLPDVDVRAEDDDTAGTEQT